MGSGSRSASFNNKPGERRSLRRMGLSLLLRFIGWRGVSSFLFSFSFSFWVCFIRELGGFVFSSLLVFILVATCHQFSVFKLYKIWQEEMILWTWFDFQVPYLILSRFFFLLLSFHGALYLFFCLLSSALLIAPSTGFSLVSSTAIKLDWPSCFRSLFFYLCYFSFVWGCGAVAGRAYLFFSFSFPLIRSYHASSTWMIVHIPWLHI